MTRPGAAVRNAGITTPQAVVNPNVGRDFAARHAMVRFGFH